MVPAKERNLSALGSFSSVEQTGLRRPPVFRQQVRWLQDGFFLQVGKHLLNDHRVFSTGIELRLTALFSIGMR
jgi:hypothetical protein